MFKYEYIFINLLILFIHHSLLLLFLFLYCFCNFVIFNFSLKKHRRIWQFFCSLASPTVLRWNTTVMKTNLSLSPVNAQPRR